MDGTARSFREQIEDPRSPVALDLEPDGRALLVAFGGIRGGLGLPPFEFFRLTGELPVKKVYVRDLRQRWYHQGLPGIASDLAGMRAFLRVVVEEARVERLVLVGNSMGGFAALLFGAWLGATAVHAFSPQTMIGPWRLLRAWDWRWPRQLAGTYLARGPRVYDLAPVLRRQAVAGALHVHYGRRAGAAGGGSGGVRV